MKGILPNDEIYYVAPELMHNYLFPEK